MKKNIKVIQGDGKNIKFSEVKEHIPELRPNTSKKEKIVIPTTKSKKKK